MRCPIVGINLLLVLVLLLAIGAAPLAQASDCPERNLLVDRAAGNNEFAFDLFKKIGMDETNTGKNIFFSPHSISTALGMTYAGARGETARQMAGVLRFESEQGQLHQSFADLVAAVDGNDRAYQLSTANALWGQKEYPFDRDFLSLIRRYYAGGFQELDFAGDTEASREKVNQWVSEKTADKVQNLLQAGDVTSLTRLILTNAIYFKGEWAVQFEKGKTRAMSFRLNPAESVNVQTMVRTDPLPYVETDSLQAIELSYAGDVSMIVLLPKEDLGLLERELSGQQIHELLANLKETRITLYLPRFKFDARYALHDKKYLPAMGMVDAFDERTADFSGLTGKKELFISGVFHKAFVDVNESGTEAAAATAVVIGVKGMPPPATVFRADHPFLFLIRHKPTGSILFLGRVSNPAK